MERKRMVGRSRGGEYSLCEARQKNVRGEKKKEVGTISSKKSEKTRVSAPLQFE